MEKKKSVFLTRIFPDIAEKMLIDAGFVVEKWDQEWPMKQEDIIEQAKKHDALLCSLSDKIDKHFFDECSHLKIISQFAVGFDNIDVKEATRLGIPIGYTPDVLSDATADIAFGLMIATSRKMFYLNRFISNGEWKHFRPNEGLGIELKNKTLGIFGLGSIGTEMAKRCKGAFNMNVIYHNRKPNLAAEENLGAKYVDFDTLLRSSDVLSVHCTLTDETRGIFDRTAFQKMKPTSIFINTSRGLVHNETDLTEALQKGIIWGAGLDVTNPEPMQPNNPLLTMENVSVLPHIGSANVETRHKMAVLAAENIIEFFSRHKVPNVVNPEVLQ